MNCSDASTKPWVATTVNLPLYMDNHSTTPLDPRVLDAMLPFFLQVFGNPSTATNLHGQAAREAVETARGKIADAAGSETSEVIFTSGATESINTVLRGVGRGVPLHELRLVTCQTEHSAVLDTCAVLEARGAQVTRLPVNSVGMIDLAQLEDALVKRPHLLSLMHANNETGVVFDIEAIGALCRAHDCLFHVDAAQSFGKIPIRFRDWQIDFMSISGHKLYAPKGVGCLLIRRQVPPLRIQPLITGGGQERGIRSGTINVPAVVGLGRAAELAGAEMEQEQQMVGSLRTQLLDELRSGISGLIVNGSMQHRLAGNLNISIPGIDGHLLLPSLKERLSVSSGSACQSGKHQASHVLAAMGVSNALAQSSLRFGLGRFHTAADTAFAAATVIDVVRQLRSPSSP